MRRSEVVLLLAVTLLVGGLLLMRSRLLEERLARHNAEAAADSSRVVYADSVRRVSERLAFQQREAIALGRDLARVLRAKNEQTQALLRLRLELDSLAGVVTRGEVTALPDTALRQLAASLDTAGFHVNVRAVVPPPPSDARVTWTVRRDPIEVVAALNRDSDGRLALRTMADRNATVRIDTVRVRITEDLGRTRRLALPLGILLAGYLLGRVVR